jgi:hypothetical protein
MKKTQNALAMINMLIFVVIFTIFAGLFLTVVSNETRIMERHIRRVKAFYLSEASTVLALEVLRRNDAFTATSVPVSLPWFNDRITGDPTSLQTVRLNVLGWGSGIVPPTKSVSSTTDYSF